MNELADSANIFGGIDAEAKQFHLWHMVALGFLVAFLVIVFILVLFMSYKYLSGKDSSGFRGQNAGAGLMMSTKPSPNRMREESPLPIDKFEGNMQTYDEPMPRLYDFGDDELDNFEHPKVSGFADFGDSTAFPGEGQDSLSYGPEDTVRAFRPETMYREGNNQSAMSNLLNDW